MISHEDPRLTAYVLGELDPADIQELQQAIEQSPELQTIVAEIQQTVAQLETSFRDQPTWELPAEESVSPAASEVTNIPGHRHSYRLLAVAASVVGLIGLGGLLAWQVLEGSGEAQFSQTSGMVHHDRNAAPDRSTARSKTIPDTAEELDRSGDRDVDPSASRPAAMTQSRGSELTGAGAAGVVAAGAGGAGAIESPAPSGSATENTVSERRLREAEIVNLGDKETPKARQIFNRVSESTGRPIKLSRSGAATGGGGQPTNRPATLSAAGEQQPVELRYQYGMEGRGGLQSASPARPARAAQTPGNSWGEAPAESRPELDASLGWGVDIQGGLHPHYRQVLRGQDPAGDRFDTITDNPFHRVAETPLSTFSIDVDTASYSKVRQTILHSRQLPRPDAVRIEEMVNYFPYDYQPPTDQHPFAARMEVASCPWNPSHRLARIALQGKIIQTDQRPDCNLVFLLDTSGSMNAQNKLPLVKQGMKMLLEKLTAKDRVAIVTYAGSAGVALRSTPVSAYQEIESAIDHLQPTGSTNGAAGIELAYQIARENFIPEGVNRVILCTDGDFNVGVTGTGSLVNLVEEQSRSKVYLSVLGFGMGNLNDAMLEQISGRGNGNYAFIDSVRESRKVLTDQINATLVTIAKDVKIQVEFNPSQVAGYRLIGYANRLLAKEDFNDDQVDAGEIGAGHQVTALYELIPPGIEDPALRPKVDDLKYQPNAEKAVPMPNDNPELLTVKLRYKQPDSDTSTLVDFGVIDEGQGFQESSPDFQFAAAVASFGMLLRDSPYKGDWNYQSVLEVAKANKGADVFELRQEFVELVQAAFQLNGEE